MPKTYSVYSEFDVEEHIRTFVNYLEVIIEENGVVEYAVPSHQEKLISVACKKLGVTRQELDNMCSVEYYCNFMTWLCKVSGCCSVWNEFVIGYEFSKEQIEALHLLKTYGVYKGTIPNEE